MLIGIAVAEGAIKSIDDTAETYVPGLKGKEYGATPIRALLHQLATLPILIGALGLLGEIAGVGIAWVAAGCIFAMLVAMFSAWVLLIEILR